MIRWTTGAVVLLAVVTALAGCGGNSTRAGITITAASATTGASSVTVPINGTEQFGATVTGVSDTLVYWQICLPGALPNTLPTTCTTIPGVTLPSGDTVLTGYGTITQNGFYTAPSAIPSKNSFVILTTSPVDTTTFATFGVTIDSGIRVQVTPASATIFEGQDAQFTATVTGTSNTSVTWEVNGVAGGDISTGYICPGPQPPPPGGSVPEPCTPGEYFSSATGVSAATISAVSGADGSTTGSATVTIVGTAPAVSGIQPPQAVQGSAQQEVYLTGSNFTSTGEVLVNGTSVPFVFLSTNSLRVPIPASALASKGNLTITFELQTLPPLTASNTTSNPAILNVVSTRPAIVAVTPQSITAAGSTATVVLTGGYFSQGTPATTVQFDNGLQPVVPSFAGSRQISVTLPSAALSTPGLYALSVANPGVTGGCVGVTPLVIPCQPNSSAVNVAVTPGAGDIPTGPSGSISLAGAGSPTQPSAIALDLADGLAVVTEEDLNAVAVICLDTTDSACSAPNTVLTTIPVGKQPTGVAVDDMLPHPLALVVNNGDNTVSVIDLKTLAIAAPPLNPLISLTGLTPTISAPVSIGINPLTHRAIVANSSTNLGTVIDLQMSNTNLSTPCPSAPCPVMVVGGTQTSFSTGAAPSIGIDPTLNWAVVSPGGAGAISIVDLGFGNPQAGSGGRAPAVIATAAISTTVQGIGINPETHTALLSDYNTGNLTALSLLDNSVNSVTNNGVALTYQGAIAAAVNPLQNVGIAVNSQGSGMAEVVDLGNHVVLQQVTGLTSSLGEGSPQAVVVDPASNEAIIVNEGALSGSTRAAGSIATVSLGTSAAKPLQILQSSPAITYTSSSSLAMTITGTGFAGGSTVLLDGVPVTTSGGAVTDVSAREITATVPVALLGSARRFAVQVQNGASVSNVEPLTVVQAVTVGSSPAGVAVDAYRDLAVVTNSGSGNISLVSVAPPSISPLSLGLPGVIGLPLPANVNPRAVAVNPREGLALAANYASNDLTLVDYSDLDLPAPYSLPPVRGCAATSVCTGPAGVAFDNDNIQFLVTDTNVGTNTSDVAFGSATAAGVGTAPTITSPLTPQPVDQTPGDIAIAPSFDPFDPINNPNPLLSYAAIASSAQTSVIDFLNLQTELVDGRTTGVSLPTGVVYDSLNHVFLVSDSLNNNIVIVNPLTFVPVFVRGGFNPASIAYNQQTSTIVTVNAATGTLSVLDYLCPPATATPACTSPHVRATIGLVGSQISSTAPLGPKTVDIDPLLNIAVLVDSENNRVLLIPLPY